MYKLKYSMRLILFLGISMVFASFQQVKLVKTKVSDDITVSIPKDWRAMDGMDFSERYPSVRAPLAAFTNYDRLADFSVNISATQWPDGNLEIATKFFKSSLTNMFDRVEMISEGIKDVHKKRFIYFEFESRVNGNKTQQGLNDPVLRYTYQMYLIEPDRTLVFTFNCTRREKENWQPTAAAIMNSIKVR
jgi:hypothetical protein